MTTGPLEQGGETLPEVIAEIGVNHDGSLAKARRLVEAAHDAGARTVKLQSFNATALAVSDAPTARYQRRTQPLASQREMLRGLELSAGEQMEVFAYAESLGLHTLATPFDEASIDFLTHDCAFTRLKIASGDLTNGPLLLRAARSGASLILSTGMSTPDEIQAALEVVAFGILEPRHRVPTKADLASAWASEEGHALVRRKVWLMHCVSQYPAPTDQVNALSIPWMRDAFRVPVGFSDHTMGTTAASVAVALGACAVEKHLTLDRTANGPDHAASLDPKGFRRLVEEVRDAWRARGIYGKQPAPCEADVMRVARRSLVARVRIDKGEVLTTENVTAKRPAGGLSPMAMWGLLGRPAVKTFLPDEWITE